MPLKLFKSSPARSDVVVPSALASNRNGGARDDPRSIVQGLERQIAYWREALAGAPVLLELPTDRPRQAQPDHTGAGAPIVLDAELTGSLKQLSQRHGATLFMTVMAAWAAVLSRLSGQEEVVIGMPTANRGHAEAEEPIGFFVNTLALRIKLGGSPSLSELLSRVREVALAAREHQDLPFEQVVEIVQPPRGSNHTPIFQVLFNWDDDRASVAPLPSVEVAPMATTHEVCRFDLKLNLSEHNDGVHGMLIYATALFNVATMERHVGYLQTVLRAMVADSEQPVAGIDLLSADERRLQLETWNATAAPYPQERCIHQVFEDQVLKRPEAPAVVHANLVLNYGELNAQANRLAHHLITLGVGPDNRVAICVERSAAMVIGLLAILKAGGAYVPLDPVYPSERLRQIVADAAPLLVLIDSAGRVALGEAVAAGRILVDLEPLREGNAAEWSSQPVENPKLPGLTSRHLAYVIYTSGSTGTPKGVMNEHRSLINRLVWMQAAYGLDGTDVVLQKTSFSFDVSGWEFFWTLLYGATLLVAAPELHKDPAGLLELIVRAGVTTVHFVPSMLGIFLMTAGVERCTALRRLICSGEALPVKQVQSCLEKLPGTQLYNLYGPTEAAIDVTAWTCPSSFQGGVVPIGRPIANTRIYVLDDQRQPVPLGTIGELYIGGVGVGRGYLNRPELTVERFVRDPFTEDAEARMYRTGDLARYLPDGNIEYLGRNDFQVKIRGFRIELGEIEARLSEHEQVREAVVVARERGDEKRLVAYVLPASEAMKTGELVSVLRAHLAGTLPDYMAPSAFVRMAAWPLTPSGKLDRKALPNPEVFAEASLPTSSRTPVSIQESRLCTLLAEAFELDEISMEDNFFDLGGHSIVGMRIANRVKSEFGVDLNLRALFDAPTLGDLIDDVVRRASPAH